MTYWHVSLSRLGLRAALLPLLSSFAMLAFWRAWTGGRIRSYGWTGAWFGLSLYTYTSARVLPLVPALFILTEIVAARARRMPAPDAEPTGRSPRRGLALALLVALLVVRAAVGRVGASSGDRRGSHRRRGCVRDEREPELPVRDGGERGQDAAAPFTTAAMPIARHNLPGRAATDVLTAALFTSGLLLALLRVRERRSRLLLIWFGVMLLPSVLSGAAPHYLRAAGALPPYALLAGYGGAGVAGLAPERGPPLGHARADRPRSDFQRRDHGA